VLLEAPSKVKARVCVVTQGSSEDEGACVGEDEGIAVEEDAARRGVLLESVQGVHRKLRTWKALH